MTCTDCAAAQETQGHWRLYDSPKCVHCTARLIQQIGRLPVGKDAITARRLVVLADAVAFGHSETEIRKLAALKEMALAPVERVKK